MIEKTFNDVSRDKVQAELTDPKLIDNSRKAYF